MDRCTCVELACVLEATARKPGNVHPGRDFADLTYLDLLASAVAVGPVLAQAEELGVARAIFAAIQATRQVTRSNTNLGIVLLLAPLCALGEDQSEAPVGSSPNNLKSILDGLTVSDTNLVYQAIDQAQPGGLSRVENQDVSDQASVRLIDAMRLAADRDTIARQYSNGFTEVFELGLPALVAALEAGSCLEEAIVWCHLTWMSQHPDSLIGRKRGQQEAQASAFEASQLLERLGSDSKKPRPGFLGDPGLAELDAWLSAKGHSRNPGTSADLVTACLFWALRTDRIEVGKLSFGSREP